jgi:hypothetical protein
LAKGTASSEPLQGSRFPTASSFAYCGVAVERPVALIAVSGEGTMFQNVIKVAVLVGAAWTATAGALAIGDGMTYPDFESQWRNPIAGRGGNSWDPMKPIGLGQQAPLTPEYQAIFEASLRDQAKGGQGNNYEAACVLSGMPRIMSLAGPMEILIQQNHTLMIFHNALPRRIYTDGRDWPKNGEPSFQGYSIGKWIDEDGDGRFDVLEAETRNFTGPRALESSGLPLHADNQTIVKERLFLDKSNPDILHNEITTIDNALTRPWTVDKQYRRERQARWSEYNCQESNTHVFIGKEQYLLSADGKLMPASKDQPPPDLRYFGQSQR